LLSKNLQRKFLQGKKLQEVISISYHVSHGGLIFAKQEFAKKILAGEKITGSNFFPYLTGV
jgi:hypothetical protein